MTLHYLDRGVPKTKTPFPNYENPCSVPSILIRMSIWLRSARTHFKEMGGYSSTPRKAKTSEEGGDDNLFYAACGMQVRFSPIFLAGCFAYKIHNKTRKQA